MCEGKGGKEKKSRWLKQRNDKKIDRLRFELSKYGRLLDKKRIQKSSIKGILSLKCRKI